MESRIRASSDIKGCPKFPRPAIQRAQIHQEEPTSQGDRPHFHPHSVATARGSCCYTKIAFAFVPEPGRG
jgi:hypothetical protein